MSGKLAKWIVLVAAVVVVIELLAIALFRQREADRPEAPAGPSPGETPVYRTFQGEAMATTFAVTLPDRPDAAEAADELFALFRRLDDEMSEWKEGSPLAAVNRAAGGEPVPVPAELRDLIRRGVEIGHRTDGAFDVTWAALWGLWDFKAAEPRVPDAAEVARRAALVDFRQVEIDDAAGTVRLPRAGMKIGLGGIAKGYALDQAAAALAARGFDSSLVVAGGQVLARGARGRRPWRVGIRDPRGPPDDYFASLELTDGSASTSGDYESYFVVDGVRYHHILDPRTGMPSRGLRSATVVAADATLADALSTAMMVLGPERATAVAGEFEVEAVLVEDTGRVVTTPGLAGRLVEHHPPRP